MRTKIAVAVVAGLVLGMAGTQLRTLSTAEAQEGPKRAFEYKVVFSHVATIPLQQSVADADGKIRVVTHGPEKSAETMTKQFNALAAEGWDYVGPVTHTTPPARDAVSPNSGVVSLFKRAK
jgi:hypothetical protein